MRWQIYLPESQAWVTCTRPRAVAWMLGGVLVRGDGYQ